MHRFVIRTEVLVRIFISSGFSTCTVGGGSGDTGDGQFTSSFDMHTTQSLKQQYKTLAAAKAQLGLKAKGWQALADKLNQPSGKDAIAQLEQLRLENAALKQQLDALKLQVANPDPIGFWLLDGNFDRSRFPDFGVPDTAFRQESVAKQFHKDLSKRFHPDKGGTAEQMANLNKLLDQVLALVEMNGGLGA
jgi:hypothetical protein